MLQCVEPRVFIFYPSPLLLDDVLDGGVSFDGAGRLHGGAEGVGHLVGVRGGTGSHSGTKEELLDDSIIIRLLTSNYK